ncbi:MAG: FAD-dependent oxidoreductase, partial [Proteobacteria bacterium]|nr:FAD-dependent oxidoreductase [Pseudomonadota bacterium]
MSNRLRADLCVIGAGSGGLSVAAGASQMGASTILIEKGLMGGDCLNFGCVPSKALLAAAHAADTIRGAHRFGVDSTGPQVDFAKVHAHIHDVIAQIAPHDSVERFTGLGVEVLQGGASFISPREVVVDGRVIEARRFIVATGSSPAIPPIPGLSDVDFLTNETIFNCVTLPQHLQIIGGGPIGLELAQAFRRLGSEVTVFEMFHALSADDPELTEILATQLRQEGIAIHEGTQVVRVDRIDDGVQITARGPDGEFATAGSHVLIATGRAPNVGELGLEAAGIEFNARGIRVDDYLRTTNKKVFAIGDVAGRLQFTHVAAYHASVVLRNALFPFKTRAQHQNIPWVTYTDPELAHVGVNEAMLAGRTDGINVLRWPFAENDRATADRNNPGLIKVITSKKGRILGASILGPHAGELIAPWVLALNQGLKIGAMARVVAPYPTYGEVSKRAAGSYYTPALFGPRMQKLVR